MNAVGIDVSNGRSTVTIRQPGEVVILPPRDYRHTQSSINDLIATIKELDGETKVCMEHTGRYCEPVASWLSAAAAIQSYGRITKPTENHEPAIRLLHGAEDRHEEQPHYAS